MSSQETPYIAPEIVGNISFERLEQLQDCPICLENMGPNESCARHTLCRQIFHTRCLLGWIDQDEDPTYPWKCTHCRQLLLEDFDHGSDDSHLRCFNERFGILHRLEALTFIDHGVWTHGNYHVRDSRLQSEDFSSLPDLKIERHGNDRSRVNQDIPLNHHRADVGVIPQHVSYEISDKILTSSASEWLRRRLANGNDNTHSDYPKDSGWRVLEYTTIENDGKHFSRTDFLVYVSSERRSDERKAIKAMASWIDQSIIEMAAEGPEIPCWSVHDYDEAWLYRSYESNYDDVKMSRWFKLPGHQRPPCMQKKKLPFRDVWDQESIFGELLTTMLSQEDWSKLKPYSIAQGIWDRFQRLNAAAAK
ncbi:MAG: hypothetical protein Q9227_005943 [Pyrenula ochraceoflavens]